MNTILFLFHFTFISISHSEENLTSKLIRAVGKGQPEIYWKLVESQGASTVDVNKVLYQAALTAEEGYSEIVKHLIKNGADPMAPYIGEIRAFNPIYNSALARHAMTQRAKEADLILDIMLAEASRKNAKSREEILSQSKKTYGGVYNDYI